MDLGAAGSSPIGRAIIGESEKASFQLEWSKGSAITIKALPNRHRGRNCGQSLLVIIPSRVSDRSTLRKRFKNLAYATRFAEDPYKRP